MKSAPLTCVPPFILWFFEILQPFLIPGMRKIDNQYKLDEYKHKSTNHANYQPNIFEANVVWNKHGANKNPNEAKNLEKPKSTTKLCKSCVHYSCL